MFSCVQREKERCLTQSYSKDTYMYTHRTFMKSKTTTQKMPSNTLITQRLWTDLGRLVGEFDVICWDYGPNLPIYDTVCNQKDTHLKTCKWSTLHRQRTSSHTKWRGNKLKSVGNKYNSKISCDIRMSRLCSTNLEASSGPMAEGITTINQRERASGPYCLWCFDIEGDAH